MVINLQSRNLHWTLRLRSPWAIFLVALLLRLAYITVAHSYRFHPVADHFEFGWEMGRVGRSLASGHGFADPFVTAGTGPTAWMPPLYPLIIAAIFRLCGSYTALSGWMLLAFNSVCNAAIAPALAKIAMQCFGGLPEAKGARISLWSAWLWAFYPPTMQYAVRWIWEMSLTAMLFTWMLVLTMRLRKAESAHASPLRLWALLGILWGLIALSNATPLLLLPVCGLWILAGSASRRRALSGAALAALLFGVCMTPWAWRNRQLFHAFIPTRGNLGAELYVGNGPQANGFPWGITVFSQPDLAEYTRRGEAAFVKQRGELARRWIAAHPSRFLQLSLKRAYFFWANVPHPADKHWFLEETRQATFTFLSVTGWLGLLLALRRRIQGAGLFAWAMVFLPLTYYFVTAGARFRHPLEPLLLLCTVYLFASAECSWAVRFSHRSLAPVQPAPS